MGKKNPARDSSTGGIEGTDTEINLVADYYSVTNKATLPQPFRLTSPKSCGVSPSNEWLRYPAHARMVRFKEKHMDLLFAAISIGGDGFINQVLTFLIMGIACAILYGMGYWFATRPKVPPIALQIWNAIFVLIGGILLINFLMGLAGKNFIKW